jgi:Mg2+ and Co2+ transporter CorA
MVVKPEKADAKESFRRVQNLRNINDFALFAKACCTSNLDVVKALRKSDLTHLKDASSLDAQKTILQGYVESSSVLEGRIKNAIDLVGYTLTLHNQLETAKVDTELRDMTGELRDVTQQLKNLQQDTVDDSATVKIITYVSAVYLPGSFVASLYGMNFFAFDTATWRLSIGHNFWIFVATWLPLTLITGAIYILTLLFHARSRGKQFSWPWTHRSPPPMTGKNQ